MNGCPHSFSFALPVPPSRRFPHGPVPSPPPLSLLILDCSRSPTLSRALTSSPLLLSIRGPSLYLSSPNVFIVAVFSRDSSPFAVCPCIASSLPRALRTKRALLSALPWNVLTTSVLLFLRRSARLLSRARTLCFAIIHYVFCTFCVPRSFSLFPRFYQRASFSTDDFPSLRLPIVPEWRSPRFSRNSESRLRSRGLFLFPLLSLFLFSSPLDIPLHYREILRFIFFKLEYF